MTSVTVDRTGNGFTSITAALAAFAPEEPLELFVKSGVYREKIFCERAHTRIVGEDRDNTIIVYGDGAYHKHADGRANGTFRSYTLWMGGGVAQLENLTVINDCGDGSTAGQGIALAADAAQVWVYNVTLRGCQDTLYTGPLPPAERQPNGFLGPRQHSPRTPSRQHYLCCIIEGDIDFIFGGAQAVFEQCTLICRNRNKAVNGYIAAPSTPEGSVGYLFYRCTVEGSAPHSFYLARPWREYGRAVFACCNLGDVVIPDGWDDWGSPANRLSCYFAEYANTGTGAYSPRAFGYCLNEAGLFTLLKQYIATPSK